MFDAQKFIDQQVGKLRDEVKGRAIIAASGGVDSTVCAVLVSRAIGDRLLAIYVDTGFMRKGETANVDKMLGRLGVNHRVVDASDEYFDALKGVTDPERKRKIIGEKFIRVFEREAKKFDAEYLVQGTIAPDWIESGGGLRDTIKSHHNVGGLPEDMNLKLVEPLRDLYKDEVRKVARALNIEVAEKQPFPGPALAIRVMGEPTRESVAIVRAGRLGRGPEPRTPEEVVRGSGPGISRQVQDVRRGSPGSAATRWSQPPSVSFFWS